MHDKFGTSDNGWLKVRIYSAGHQAQTWSPRRFINDASLQVLK